MKWYIEKGSEKRIVKMWRQRVSERVRIYILSWGGFDVLRCLGLRIGGCGDGKRDGDRNEVVKQNRVEYQKESYIRLGNKGFSWKIVWKQVSRCMINEGGKIGDSYFLEKEKKKGELEGLWIQEYKMDFGG